MVKSPPPSVPPSSSNSIPGRRDRSDPAYWYRQKSEDRYCTTVSHQVFVEVEQLFSDELWTGTVLLLVLEVEQRVDLQKHQVRARCWTSSSNGAAPPYLFLRRRPELLGLLGGEGCRHVERQHHLVVAEPLVVLETGHEVVGEGHHRLDAVTHLTVTQVLQHVARLTGQDNNHRVSEAPSHDWTNWINLNLGIQPSNSSAANVLIL